MKDRLTAISQSTAIKNPKLLISELCSAMQLLIVEIEKIQSPKMTVLTQNPVVKDGCANVDSDDIPERPRRIPPLVPPNRTRPFNAGDAE